MEWKKNEPPPTPAREEYELKIKGVRIVMFRDLPTDSFRCWGDVTNFGLLASEQITDVEEAKALAIRNMRNRLAAALVDFDAAVADAQTMEASGVKS